MSVTSKDSAPSREDWMDLLSSVRVVAGVLDLTEDQAGDIPYSLASEVGECLRSNAEYLEGLAIVMRAAAHHLDCK